ncbi:MAG: multiheme c-type cytochrome [Polyangiales bacterium]
MRARSPKIVRRHAAYVWTFFLLGCSGGGGAPGQADGGASPALGALTRTQLLDPENCKGCHPAHYREWASSMHAYAAKDPVFVAMNRRGQRETHGELGDFCIRCHAPMAVIDGRTKDGLDLERLPDKERGVSCYFCHNVAAIEGDHNAMLHLANDTTMRGPIRDPARPYAHRAQYSDMFEDTSPNSSALCGGCHDIVTRTGVHLERTFEEYRNGLFSKSATGAPPAFDSCVGCHMPGQMALAAVLPEGAPPRTVHEHLWPGIDVPLTTFPHRDALRSAVEDCELGVASISFFTLEVTPPDLFTFQLETKAGHNQPSGAAQDRRMWLEFSAYDESGKLLDEVSSGKIADGEIEDKPQGDPRRDPHLLMFRDRTYDAQGKPVHMFWQAGMSTAHPDGYESNVLPVATTTYIDGKHVVLKQYQASGSAGLPAHVTARLRMRPIGMDVLQDLVDSGDLDPAIVAQMPTLTFSAQIDWTPESGVRKTISATPTADCSTYRCLLDPGSKYCH